MRPATLHALTTATLLVAATPLRAQQPPACSVDRFHRDLVLSKATAVFLDDGAPPMHHRPGYGFPVVPPDSIRLVTEERVCERLAQLYYRSRLGPRSAKGVAVARVGDLYLVYGEGRPPGSYFDLLGIYTTAFVLVLTLPA